MHYTGFAILFTLAWIISPFILMRAACCSQTQANTACSTAWFLPWRSLTFFAICLLSRVMSDCECDKSLDIAALLGALASLNIALAHPANATLDVFSPEFVLRIFSSQICFFLRMVNLTLGILWVRVSGRGWRTTR